MLEKLTYESMQSYLNAEFRVMEDDAVAASLVLVEVRDLLTAATAPPAGRRDPFSLLFQAPRTFRRQQGTVSLQSDELGPLDIFVVPVDEDEKGVYYEAVFN